MDTLKNDFISRVSEIIDDQKILTQLDVLTTNLLIKCAKSFEVREGVLILDEKNRIVDCDEIVCSWFNIKKEDLLGKSFYEVISDKFQDYAHYILKKIKTNTFYKTKKFEIFFNDREIKVDLTGEIFSINDKKYIVLNLKKLEIDSVAYKLNVIEEEIANLIVRIKDFESLLKEILKIFIDSKLFDFGWFAKIDFDMKQIIPIVTLNENEEDIEFKKQAFDFNYFKGLLDVLVKREEIIIDNVEFGEHKYKKCIIFPFFKKWDYEKIEEISYAALFYSDENLQFNNDDMNLLKEIMYKINLAITDIFIKENAQMIISTDTLTALPKRDVFLKKIKSLLSEKVPFAVAVIDIDKLKKVNDVLGFWAGDKAILSLADFLRNSLKKSFIARIGSDEFGIIIKGEKKKIFEKLNKILKFNDKILQINGSGVFLPISIGVSFYPDDGLKEEDLIIKAEKALENVKKRGGKNIGYANKNLTLLPKDYLEIEKELKEAIKNDEYVMYYQPIMDRNEKIWGVEALLRWKSKKRGLVSPGRFIPILEESGLINEVGDIIIEKVLKDAKEFEEHNIKFSFSMNVSVTQLLSQNLALKLIKKIDEINVNKDNIIVEITESVLMENIGIIMPQIELLDKEGIKIEIDDFGTGYSSLSYLRKLPVSALKIDRSFVMEIEEEEDEQIIKAIISMAKALNKKTIAEGVENRKTLEKLLALGVDYIQGYYYAKPMPKEELREFVKRF